MPPKINLTQGQGRLMIRSYEGGDWHDLGEVVKEAITFEERLPDSISVSNFGPIKLTFELKLNRRKLRKAIQKFFLKPRKTTYKTIRHDCAKRNGRR